MNAMKLKIAGKPEKPVHETVTKSLKAFDEYSVRFSVLGVPFGGVHDGRDSDGEAFTKDTNIWLQVGDEVPVTYYHGFGPDDPDEWQENPAILGRAKYTKMDERGYWFDVKLDETDELAQRIISDPLKSRASSGAVGHLVRYNEDRTISVWPVGELALFDTNEWRLPANELAVIEAAKADEGGLTVKADEAEAAVTSDVVAEEIDQPIQGETKMEDENKEVQVHEPVSRDEVKAWITDAFKALHEEAPAVKSAPAVVQSLGDPDPSKAFLKYLRTGEKVKAAMQEGTPAEGGYIVPDDFYRNIVAKRDEMSVARKAGARVIQTSRDVINIPYEDTSMSNFSITAEEAAVSENEPTLGSVTATIYKFTKLVKVSEELLEDEDANLIPFLNDAFGRAAALTENAYFIAGTGSGQPQGVLYGGTAGLSLDSQTTIGAAEVPELYFKLGSAYADGSECWVMRNATLGILMGLTGNAFQFMPTPAGGLQKQLMGKPVFVSDSMGAVAASGKSMVIGNWNYYAIAERRGMSIRRLNELYAGNGQVGFLATMRFGGAVLQAEAFQYATQHS